MLEAWQRIPAFFPHSPEGMRVEITSNPESVFMITQKY
jgi:hypothetical protein